MARDDRLVRASVPAPEAVGAGLDAAGLLQTLTDRCVSLLPDVDAAAVLFADDGGVAQILAAATEPAHVIAVRRLHLDEGPGQECLRTGRQLACTDFRGGDERWPRFAVTAARAGLRAAVSVPMRRDDRTIGAVTLFSKRSGAPGDDELRIARALVDAAAAGVVQQRELDHQRTTVRHLQVALDSRVIIEQAKGMLAGRHGVDVDQAFDAMRAHARAHNRELHELAHEIVARTIDVM